MDTTLPVIVIDIHRYTQPEDGWAFTMLEPDQGGSENPFDGFYVTHKDARYFRSSVHGWGRTDWAENWRLEVLPGFTKVAWADVPEHFRQYVIGCILPIEWHASDEAWFDEMVTVWLKGEWPAYVEGEEPERTCGYVFADDKGCTLSEEWHGHLGQHPFTPLEKVEENDPDADYPFGYAVLGGGAAAVLPRRKRGGRKD